MIQDSEALSTNNNYM